MNLWKAITVRIDSYEFQLMVVESFMAQLLFGTLLSVSGVLIDWAGYNAICYKSMNLSLI